MINLKRFNESQHHEQVTFTSQRERLERERWRRKKKKKSGECLMKALYDGNTKLLI